MPEPRYFTVNITVENEVGELFAVWRIDHPILNVELAIAAGITAAETLREELGLGFDRMDDQ